MFSRGADTLYAKYLWGELEGFPHVMAFNEAEWLHNLKDAKAVVVPVLSLNTLSKLSLLLADNFTSNVLLHALFAGKPVVMARNGTDPSDKVRRFRTSTIAHRCWPPQSKRDFKLSVDTDAGSPM